jgi:hypothetical protein
MVLYGYILVIVWVYMVNNYDFIWFIYMVLAWFYMVYQG